MNAIKFWRDVWRGHKGARPIALGIATLTIAAVACQLTGLID